MLDRLISQLDTLVPFLGLAHDEIFQVIHDKNRDWFSSSQREALPETFTAYQGQVAVSAFLLGYSYFEAFIADLAKAILVSRPQLLPKDKNVSFGAVIDSGDYDILLGKIVEQQVLSVMYNSIEKVSEYFHKSLHIQWPEATDEYTVVKASLIRNCFMHNGGIVDTRLSNVSGLTEGAEIEIAPADVHQYGINIRHFARNVYQQAESKHLNNHA